MTPEINRKFLTSEELGELYDLQHEQAGAGLSGVGQFRRAYPWTTAISAIYLLVGLAALIGLGYGGEGMLILALAVAFGGGAVLIVSAVSESRRWRDRRVADYLDRIGYHQRTCPPAFADREDRARPKAPGQLRKEWYNDGGPHPHLTRRDHDLVNGVFGMSADEWESNKPD